MGQIELFTIDETNVDERLIPKLSRILCYQEPERLASVSQFWRDWFSERIKGEKYTVVAQESDDIAGNTELVGVTRLWKSPYCGNKWLIEGLEIISPKRKQGIGRMLVKESIKILSDAGVDMVSVHISRTNKASIGLHLSFGFKKTSTGTYNSYGDFRKNIDEYVLKLL